METRTESAPADGGVESRRSVRHGRPERQVRPRRTPFGCGVHPDSPSAATRTAASVVTALTLLVAFGTMALGVPWFWLAFPVGFGGVLPLTLAAVARRDRRADADRGRPDPVARLQERYVRGELSEAEFEARLEALLAVEEERGSSRSSDV